MSRSKWLSVIVASMFISCLGLAADKPAASSAPASKPASAPTSMTAKFGGGTMVIMDEGQGQPMVINIGEGGVVTTGKGCPMPGAPMGPVGKMKGMGQPTGWGVFTAESTVTLTMPKIKAAHLGVATEPVPEVLTEQLKLPRGTALAVSMVEPDSPAAAAGLKKNDLLIKLDDQLLINLPQLMVLVRMHKAGDEVKITYMRQGQTQTATAKLVEREQPDMPACPFMGMPGAGPMPFMGNAMGGAGCCGKMMHPMQGCPMQFVDGDDDDDNEQAEEGEHDQKEKPRAIRVEVKATPQK